MRDKQDWMTRWAPMLAVLGTLLVAGAAAVFYLGGELGRIGGELRRLDQGQTELKAGLTRLETRVDAMIGELRGELRENRAEVAGVRDVSDVRERVSALEAAG